jgi:hypothetical protein
LWILFFENICARFLQVYDDSEEGRKVMSYYQLCTAPVILVLDPLTGQKRREWKGFVEHERLLEVSMMGLLSLSQSCFFAFDFLIFVDPLAGQKRYE